MSVGRAYKVQWKKSKPDLSKLARLYWIEGLTQRKIAELAGVRRAVVSMAVKQFETNFNDELLSYNEFNDQLNSSV